MAATATPRDVSLQNTPTWAVAAVFFLLIAVSLLLVHCIQCLGKWLKSHRKNALVDATEKLKEELMILGFISMLLAVSQNPISRICVPTKVADTMLPCRRVASTLGAALPPVDGGHLRRLLYWADSRHPVDHEYHTTSWKPARMLLSGGEDRDTKADFCDAKEGKVSLVSQAGVHQLHIFVFVLAVVHVLYSVVTMALGKAKMRRWKAWEEETQTFDYQMTYDSRRFRYTRETSFARRHVTVWTEFSLLLWIVCFFRQFFISVGKVDYFTLRHGFISAHFPNFKSFNFQRHIKRSLENDFKAVVRISPAMWLIVVVLMLINVRGWYSYFWMSFVPLIVALTVGTKLHHIVAEMALQLDKNAPVVVGTPLVRPSDELFWFGSPKFVLSLLHLILFQNAFEFTFFIWVWFEFGLHSCYHEKIEATIARAVLAVVVQFLCSYITLPLYALVTQMGSEYKWSAHQERTANALRQWHADARNKSKLQLDHRWQPSEDFTSSLVPVPAGDGLSTPARI